MHPESELSIFKVTLQVLAQVDQRQQVTIYVLGHCEPDHPRMARARYVRACLSQTTPHAWLN